MDLPKAQPITVQMPLMPVVCIQKRNRIIPDFQVKANTISQIPCQFYPPNSAELWPKTFGDIDDSFLKTLLKWGGIDAVGILVDGIIYTDDCIFWLSKVPGQSEAHIVYSNPPTNFHEMVQEMFKWRAKPHYLNEYPVFQKPPPETPIIFENFQDWHRFKARYQNRYKYGIDLDDLRNEPPPPYEP